jgi:hypothetical protein
MREQLGWWNPLYWLAYGCGYAGSALAARSADALEASESPVETGAIIVSVPVRTVIHRRQWANRWAGRLDVLSEFCEDQPITGPAMQFGPDDEDGSEMPEGTHDIIEDPNQLNTDSTEVHNTSSLAGETPDRHDSHHMVPWNDPRAESAREVLLDSGWTPEEIEYDPRNRVFLPRPSAARPGDIEPEAYTPHEDTFTDRYFEILNERLETARVLGDVDAEMEQIREDLINGEFFRNY